ncbi:MAG: TolC family protein [Nitrospiraceae bacterium]|nr:TolC family protein [Nitrospiraceae bacterium]
MKLGRYIILQLSLVSLALFVPFAAFGEQLSLKECLSAAMTNNPAVSEARLNVAAGEQGIVSAQGKQFPRVSLDTIFIRRQDPTAFIPAQSAQIGPHFSDEYGAGTLMMTVPVYQGGQLTNGVGLAKLRTRLQENSLALTRNDLIANTVNAYNKLLQTGKLKEASQASLRALEEQRKNSQLLFDVGRIARVDLLKIEVQLANERQRLLSLEEAERTLTATLRFLMGQQADATPETLTPADSLTMVPVRTDLAKGINAARMNRPEYLTARAGVDEAELNRKITGGKMLPTVSASAGYLDQYSFRPNYQEVNWFVGGVLSIPLFDRSLYADYKRDKILKSRAEQRLLSVENQMRLDIQTAVSSLEESRNRVATAEQAIAQADESFRIEQEKYRNGAGVMSDLLLAQAADMTAAANYTQALFDYNAAVVAWRRATGTLEEYLK